MPAKPDQQLPVSQGAQTPLVELLRRIPFDYRAEWTEQLGLRATNLAPVGRYCHEAADRIEALTRSGEQEPAPSTSEINALRDALAIAERAIAEVVEGNPMGTRRKIDLCPHDRYSWEGCEQCTENVLLPALEAVRAALSIPQSEAGEGVMRGPNNGVNCPQRGVRLPAGYSSPCPDCGTEDSTPTAQTEGSGLAGELAALSIEAHGSRLAMGEWMLENRDRILTALSSAPAEFHMGGAAAALAITEPMQSAPADVREALQDIAALAEHRIKDGIEMGATIWRIALEDIAKDARAALERTAK